MTKSSAQATVAPKESAPDPTAVVLRYVGAGAWLPNIPARDLTLGDIVALEDASVASRAFLEACGLYELLDQILKAATAALEET